jgi:hypothetical protein
MAHPRQLNIIYIGALTLDEPTRLMSRFAATDIALVIGYRIKHQSFEIYWLIHNQFSQSS